MKRAALRLNRLGLKATTPRLLVLEIFESSEQRHLTADDVVRQADRRDLMLGLPTIYRVLTQLTQARVLTRHMFDFERASYCLTPSRPHTYLVCLDCGAIDEFVDDVIEARHQLAARRRDFEILEPQDVLHGRCALCRQARTKKRKA